MQKSPVVHPVVRRSMVRRTAAAILAALALLTGMPSVRAASTGQTALYMPQGEGAGTPNGDYVTSIAGLNTVYRYFVEVPPGLSRLVVEIYDADVGAGGTAEANAGRDRQRETTNNNDWNTTATYSLVNPSGATRTTQFTTGNSTTPAGADGQWLALIDSTGDTVRDNFATAAYTNNDGLVNWAGNWIETNDDNNAGNGQVRITGGELRVGDNGAPFSVIEREANLSAAGFTTATLSFNVRTTGVDATDVMQVQVSANGGGAWTNLETFTGPVGATTRSYNITSSIATNTRIRFIAGNGYGNNDFFFVDNLQIQETGIDAGHWEVRLDMSSAEAADDDINAFGIRAHDGTSDGGGTELNVYYDSHNQFGVNPSGTGTGANSRSYAIYPYLTSGCSAFKNDFDYDSNNGTVGSLSFTSRTGTFTQNFASATLSQNDAWTRNSFTGWTSDTLSTGYGIWPSTLGISTYFTNNGATINGNYANLWLSNFQAASATPAANPTTNAFRVYLPTDAAGTPVKPYVEQLATFTGCGLSGPNPPNTGQTSCFTVTVQVVNPTTRSITFSTPSNLVTANVPGGGAVYAGGAQATAGTTIVSQPAVGGTGNITWNPGTVGAGVTKLLSYRVNVTPVSNGQRIPLTATPASGNGTRAQYLDETGNAAQARATYLFGPLCELAVTEDLITQAVVSSFRASAAAGGGVQVEWSTASEVGTAGFYLYRWNAGSRSWASVNHELLAGLIHEPQGGVYRFVDGGASPRESQTYLLEEVEAGGRRRTLGPFAVEVDWSHDKTGLTGSADYAREAHPAPLRGTPPQSKALSIKPGSSAGTHLSVPTTGLYYVSSADVAAWLGVTRSLAESLITQGQIALSRGGQPVAWMPDLTPGSDTTKRTAQGLFFYGQAPDSHYEAASTYRLERGPGLLMQTVSAGAPAGAAAVSFPETRHAEHDAFAATLISPDPEADYWFWEFLQGDDATFGHRTFPLDAPGLAVGQGGTLAVSLYGATASGVTDEHQAVVALNGTILGETRWQGIAARQATFAIPAGVLQAAGNQVEVTAHTGAGAPFSIYYVDGFDLSYPRTFQAVGDTLTFRVEGKAKVTVAGFTSSAIRLLDVGDSFHPRWITGATVEADGAGGFRMSFAPSAPGPFLAAAPAALAAPTDPRPWSLPSLSLRSPDNRADYLVIAPSGFQAAAKRLAALRRAQGLEARVVDLEAIFDEFSFGAFNPHAIRDFLALAWQSWSLPPRYVALAGAGTLDYRNLLGFGDDLVPPLMVSTTGGLFPSDNLLGDVDGDGLSEVAVGRIPVLSAAELNAYTDKIAAFEAAAPADWTARALLLSDAADGGADFAADNLKVAAQLPGGYTVDRIDLTSTPLAAARAQLLAELANGTAFINYLGHGALDRLSAGGLLTSADVPGLANGERLPVLTAMTCTINRFAVPGVPALGELLVKAPAGGAAAVWGPSGLSFHGDARLLAERFYHAADERLGDRLHRAVAEFRDLGGDPALPRIYDLLGDPALRLKSPAIPVPAPAGSGE